MDEKQETPKPAETKGKRAPMAEGHGIRKIRAERKRKRQAIKQNRAKK